MQTQYNRKYDNRINAIFALAAVIAISGCSSGNHGIVGKWHIDSNGPGGITVTKTYEFKPDGTMVETMNGTTTFATYHYTLAGESLTLLQTGANVDGKEVGVYGGNAAPRTMKFEIDDGKLTLTVGTTDTVMVAG